MHEQGIELYRAAIGEQFPELSIATIRYLSEGWDSVACLVNERLVFRFPKRAAVEPRLQREIRLLPALAPLLPLPIPQFSYVATAGGQQFPRIFVGYEALAGKSLMDWPAELQAAEWWRAPLGAFATALHAFPLAEARALGAANMSLTGPLLGVHDEPPSWRATVQDYYQLTQQRVYPLLEPEEQALLARRFESFLANEQNFAFEPVLLHADLSEDHVLLDVEQQRVCGVIDFGDMAIGDPALDIWPELVPFYGGRLGPGFLERHRFYQRLSPLNGIIFGQSHDDDALLTEDLGYLRESLRREASQS